MRLSKIATFASIVLASTAAFAAVTPRVRRGPTAPRLIAPRATPKPKATAQSISPQPATQTQATQTQATQTQAA
jgi:hypothetical protein